MSEIASSTQINVNTAHRLLQTLTRRGYAEQNPDTRSYSRGPRLLELGSAYASHHDLIGAALPRLEELRDKVGETIYLAIYSDGDNVEIRTAAGRQAVSSGSAPPTASLPTVRRPGKPSWHSFPSRVSKGSVSADPWSAAQPRAASARLPW